jgi:hypothetical protein
LKSTYLWSSILTVLMLALPLGNAVEYCCPRCCWGGIYCSPVFHMPLQPAPSPANGGWYCMRANGQLQGPNYCLRPPFTPITGFNGTAVGQEIFQKVFLDLYKPKKNEPPKTVGVGGYNADYSDPQSLPYFNHHPQPMPQGYLPPGEHMPPGGPMPGGHMPGGPMPNGGPMPHGGHMPLGPGFGPPPGYPGMPGPGMPPPGFMPSEKSHNGQIVQGPGDMNGLYRTSYLGRGPIRQVQAGEQNGGVSLPNPGYAMPQQAIPYLDYSTPLPYYGYGMCPVPMPAYGWGPANMGYSMAWPGYYLPPMPLPAPGYQPGYAPPLPAPGYVPPQVYMPTPGYAPAQPVTMPTPQYSPNLPNVGYEPPTPPPTTAVYPSHSLVRSPRDFFMWIESQEDKATREKRALPVP